MKLFCIGARSPGDPDEEVYGESTHQYDTPGIAKLAITKHFAGT
ncbi:MAG TPA: hypothetical protein VKA68_13530 [bacterium]|nr:hypothetical protein [bacterium]